MTTLIHQRVAAANAGENPTVIARLKSGWAVMGDVQFLQGYCLLLPDPVVPTLNDLEGAAREQFLADYVALGDAVLDVTGAIRINYEVLGNLEPALHGHVFPRFADEPEDLRTKPVWFYDWDAAPKFDENAHGALKQQIADALVRKGNIK